MAKRTKQPKTTLQKYNSWRRREYALIGAKFAAPLIPFGVTLGVNWNDWVGSRSSDGWSIGTGLGMLALATIASIAAIWKKDELMKSKMSGLLYVAIIFAVVGFGFMLMASMMNEMGKMFLVVAGGLLGSFAIDQVDKSYVKKKVAFYEELVDKNGLSKSAAKNMDETEQARIEGEKAKAERVRFHPHD